MKTLIKTFFLSFIIILISPIQAGCEELLTESDCLYWSYFCEWNNDCGVCQDIGEDGCDGNNDNDYEQSCIPFNQIESIPTNTTEYADMCMEHIGVPPIVDCGEGVEIPIYVNGEYVTEDQPTGQCDNTDFKGGCFRGSTVARIEGTDQYGDPMPEVVWVYFCRSQGADYLEQGIVSVQMIGYNQETGATCFFESPDAVGDLIQAQYLSFDDNGILDGEFPGYGTPGFDQVFHSPSVSQTNCISCHTSDPFIHNPWLDGARLPSDPSQPVVPELATPDLPYFAVGGYGSQWDNRSIHIPENQCLSCHRSSMFLAYDTYDQIGHVTINDFMPPYNPGSLSDDYLELIECWVNNPENTDNCYWMLPPGGGCETEIIGLNIGDLNGDSLTNISDVIILINLILNNQYQSNGDLNQDQIINIQDVIMLIDIILN